MNEYPFKGSQPAPSLSGGVSWINTAGPVDLADLKGKFVILDFWTYCCINCIHILPELKKLEEAYPNEVVVIGVHSAKFDAEQDSANIQEAVERYEIAHPVVNDANHVIWDRYGAQSWPTICIIDPQGNLIVRESGEIPFTAFDGFLKKYLPYFRDQKQLDPTPLHFDLAAMKARQTPLRYPGKLIADEAGGRLFISDSNHNRIVVSSLDGKLLDVIGAGSIGSADGEYGKAQFDHPQGMALVGDALFVADTENHLIRRVDLAAKQVSTVAGIGSQSRGWYRDLEAPEWRGDGRAVALNSPWDLYERDGWLYIAMAGSHQIWRMQLSDSKIELYAGNGREDIVDGPLLPSEPYAEGTCSFAQPSGLTADDKYLFVADSEGSSIRAVPFDREKDVVTIIGTAHLPVARLFTFGDVDGVSPDARLQHALGVAYHAGKIFVTDTYNQKIKVVDAETLSSKTFSGTGQPGDANDPAQFHEPCGIAFAGEKLYVADTNNHAIRVIDLANKDQVSTLEIAGLNPPAPEKPVAKGDFENAIQETLPAVTVKPADGKITLRFVNQLPTGYKLNPLAPFVYRIDVVGEAGPLHSAALAKLTRVDAPTLPWELTLPVNAEAGEFTLTIGTNYFYCSEDPAGLCKMTSVVRTIPIKLDPAADQTAVELKIAAPPAAVK